MRLACVFLALGMVACAPTAPVVEGPSPGPALRSELRTQPPIGLSGCWHETIAPAIFETVTEQVLVSPAVVDAQGRTITPAVFRTETQQRQVQARQKGWFRIPCETDLVGNPGVFMASLQRALKARGVYGGDITGMSDPATLEAVRRFQRPFGLESDVLSYAGAQALGLISSVK